MGCKDTEPNSDQAMEIGVKTEAVVESIRMDKEQLWLLNSTLPCCSCPVPGSIQGQAGDGSWSNLGWWKVVPARGRGWDGMLCKVPSNPNHCIFL